jgi:hypothetical protein
MRSARVPTNEDDSASVTSVNDRNPGNGAVGGGRDRRMVDPERQRGPYEYANDNEHDVEDDNVLDHSNSNTNTDGNDTNSYEEYNAHGPDPVEMAVVDVRARQAARKRACVWFVVMSGLVVMVLGVVLGVLYGTNSSADANAEANRSSGNGEGEAVQANNQIEPYMEGHNGIGPPHNNVDYNNNGAGGTNIATNIATNTNVDPSSTSNPNPSITSTTSSTDTTRYVVPEPSMDLALVCNTELFTSEEAIDAVRACRTECEAGLCCWIIKEDDPLMESCYDWGETNSVTCTQYYEPCILLETYNVNGNENDFVVVEADGDTVNDGNGNGDKDQERPVDTLDVDNLALSNPPTINDNIWRDGREDAKWTLLLYEDFEGPETERTFQPGGDNSGKGAEFYTEEEDTIDTVDAKMGYTNSGSSSMAISDHNDERSSMQLTQDLDLTYYGQVRIRFWFKGAMDGKGMEGYYENGDHGSDFFVLEYSPDSGNSWEHIKEYHASSQDFIMNGSPQEEVVTISRLAEEVYDFTNQARFRFRSNANSANDRVYIDDVEISGGPPEEGVVGVQEKHPNNVWSAQADSEKWTVLTYDHFEYGLDDDRCNFQSSGKGGDVSIYSITPTEGWPLYVNSGVQSVRLRDDNDENNACIYHKRDLDVSMYTQLRVRFWVVGDEEKSFEEDNLFRLGFSSDGEDVDNGTNESWWSIKEFQYGTPDFPVMATPLEQVVLLDRQHDDLDFSTKTARFRFASDANSNTDVIYIDDIEVSGRGVYVNVPDTEHIAQQEEDRPEVVPEIKFWDEDVDGGTSWETITFDDFEIGGMESSSYQTVDDEDADNNGHRDVAVKMSDQGPPFSNSGYGSVRLSDKTDYDKDGNLVDATEKDATIAYFYHSQSYDVSMYQQLRILFWFLGDEDKGFSTDEYFVLEYSPYEADGDSGTEEASWTEIKRWARGTPEFYRNGVGYLGFAYMNASDNPTVFTEHARLRFHSYASGSKDRVYMDDIEWSGTKGTPVIGLSSLADIPDALLPDAPFPIWQADFDDGNGDNEGADADSSLYEDWTILQYDDFEDLESESDDNKLSGSFFETGAGSDSDHVRLYSDGRPNCNSGTHSVRIQESQDDASAIWYKSDVDCSTYTQLRVRFWFRGRGDNDLGYDNGDSFVLELSSDSAQTWQILKEWEYGSDDFEHNGIDYLGLLMLENPFTDGGFEFTANVRLRFRSISKDDEAKLFIDDVELAGR